MGVRRGITWVARVCCGLGPAAAVGIGCGADSSPGEPESSRASQFRLDESLTNPGPEPERGFWISNDGTGVKVDNNAIARMHRRRMTADEVAAIEAAHPSVAPTASLTGQDPGPSPKQELLDAAAKLGPKDMIKVLVSLPDLPFAWKELRNTSLTEENRAAIIDTRKKQAAKITSPLADKLRSLGANVLTEHWLAPVVVADVPAGRVAEVAQWREIESISGDSIGRPLAAYGGEETRNGMRLDAFRYYNIQGQSGGRAGGRIRHGIVDVPYLKNHAAFKRFSGGQFVNYITTYLCNGTGCSSGTLPEPSDSSPYQQHGTRVARALLGSIEAGQVPGITDGVQRRKRSGVGMSAAADAYYYGMQTGSCSEFLAALWQSQSNSVDVLNVSMGWGSGSQVCNKTYECASGANQMLRNARDAGVLVVAAAGGDSSSSCKVKWPAVRRDTLTVGALNTPTDTTVYDTAAAHAYSPRGGMTVGNGSHIYVWSLVDLMTPGVWSWWYRPGYYDFDETADSTGTSYAAPSMAAGAGLLRCGVVGFGGWTWAQGVLLHANVFLMNDGYGYSAGGRTWKGMDYKSGAGRSKLHFPSDYNLTAPWGWGCQEFYMDHWGEVAFSIGDSGRESTAITQLKTVLMWDEFDYTNVANIRLAMYNTCGIGEFPNYMDSDDSGDIRRRLEFRADRIGGKCLSVYVQGAYVPAGQNRLAYLCTYYHSGDVNNH